jgi:hypothetical protein
MERFGRQDRAVLREEVVLFGTARLRCGASQVPRVVQLCPSLLAVPLTAHRGAQMGRMDARNQAALKFSQVDRRQFQQETQ